jgi:hypothetical protein
VWRPAQRARLGPPRLPAMDHSNIWNDFAMLGLTALLVVAVIL